MFHTRALGLGLRLWVLTVLLRMRAGLWSLQITPRFWYFWANDPRPKELRIAALGSGKRLKVVFDFQDWAVLQESLEGEGKMIL